MAYDPNFRPLGADVTALGFRTQFQGLKDLMDAGGVVAVQIHGVTAPPPGDPASVNVSFTAGVMDLTFAIPQGIQGQRGPLGIDGPPGPPFVSLIIDSADTLPAGLGRHRGPELRWDEYPPILRHPRRQ